MQLSEEQLDDLWDECACEDGSIPFVSRRRFVEKVLEFRAQADARPVGHFFKASRVHPWVQVEKECPNAVPLYTHPEASTTLRVFFDKEELDALYEAIEWAKDEGLPGTAEHLQAIFEAHNPEASAPGLSDDEITDVWIKYGGTMNGNNFHGFARAILTRASAATVGEPIAEIRHRNGHPYAAMRKAYDASGNTLAEGTLLYAGAQQAEPGADERAAEIGFQTTIEDDPDRCTHVMLHGRRWYREDHPKCAAQSGQRADHEEILADYRRLVRELDVLLNGEAGAAKQASLCDIVAQVKREGIKAGQRAGGAEDADMRDKLYFALVGAEDQLRRIAKLIGEDHDFIDKGRTIEMWADIAKSALLAATTQQQEGDQ